MSAKNAYMYWRTQWSDMQDHLPMLFSAARGQCLEIGTRYGVSTAALLAGIEEHGGHLISLDINNCAGVFRGHPQWSFIQGDSHTMTREIKDVLRDFDVAFIDGDHTYEGALADLRDYGKRAKRVFVHDTDAPDFPGVRRAVDQFCTETGRKVKYHSGSFGLAEIN